MRRIQGNGAHSHHQAITTGGDMVTLAKRHDGRAGNELRPFASDQGALFRADGSARMSHGNSTVLAAVYGPGQAKSRRNEHIEKATLDVCFKLEKGQLTSKEKEYEQIIRQTFEPVIVADDFPRAVISIVVQVIEDNGSISSFASHLCAYIRIACVSINAVSLALLDAGVPMLSVVTSATCGLLPDGNLFLDPSLAEEEVPIDVVYL
ncbi:Exosome complex exonuclease rrp46, partial [Globisporangium splendens]